MLLELADELTAKITRLDAQIAAQLETIPGLGGVCTGCGQPGPAGPRTGCGDRVLCVIERPGEIPGVGVEAAQVIVAELGTDMSQFPTPAHAAAWGRLTPRTIQSGAARKPSSPAPGSSPGPLTSSSTTPASATPNSDPITTTSATRYARAATRSASSKDSTPA